MTSRAAGRPARARGSRSHVVLLRAIAHVPMAPMRSAVEDLGFEDVQSFGMSGNLLFDAPGADPRELERRIAERLETDAFVRTSADMRRVVAAHPFAEREGAAVLFLSGAPAAGRRKALDELEFEGQPPFLTGREVHMVYPVAVIGRRGPLDFERFLDRRGTARSFAVVKRILDLMSGL